MFSCSLLGLVVAILLLQLFVPAQSNVLVGTLSDVRSCQSQIT